MMTIKERARWLERHCHITNRIEMMTDHGLLVVKIFNRKGKAVRVTYKDGEPVDIQRAPDELLRPINPRWKDFEFGGF